jgi:hypothetical protein
MKGSLMKLIYISAFSGKGHAKIWGSSSGMAKVMTATGKSSILNKLTP